jgi:acyl-CoA reductase-like NAD-dependent aldehyde dehydrogenase
MSGLDISCAFGGFKQSGIGREFGLAGLEAYTEFRYLTNRMQ